MNNLYSKTINYCFRSRIGIKARNYHKIIEMNWHGDNFITFQFNSIQFWNKIIELNCFLKKNYLSYWQCQFDIWPWIAKGYLAASRVILLSTHFIVIFSILRPVLSMFRLHLRNKFWTPKLYVFWQQTWKTAQLDKHFLLKFSTYINGCQGVVQLKVIVLDYPG